jgi:ribosome-associated toxin RatA of RatAB toxin-antitoxin module
MFFLIVLQSGESHANTEKHVSIDAIKENGSYVGARAVGIIDASSNAVWDLLVDYEAAAKFMPNIKSSRILKCKGNRVLTKTVVGIALFEKTFYSQSVLMKEKNMIQWKQVKGFFKENRGYWKLKPIGNNKTELTYTIYLRHPLIPSWIQRLLLKRSIPDLFQAIRLRLKH